MSREDVRRHPPKKRINQFKVTKTKVIRSDTKGKYSIIIIKEKFYSLGTAGLQFKLNIFLSQESCTRSVIKCAYSIS